MCIYIWVYGIQYDKILIRQNKIQQYLEFLKVSNHLLSIYTIEKFRQCTFSLLKSLKMVLY